MRRVKSAIYKSWRHILATFFIIVLPFVALLFFSKIAKITASELFLETFVSVIRMLAAYLISAAIAWLAAVAFYRGTRANVALPIFDVLQSFPTSAALPIAAVFLGASNFTIIFFLALQMIWPILFSIVSSLKLIRRDWEEAAEISGLRGLKYLKNFLLPASIPALITGSIIGLGDGWESLVATEVIVGVKSGVGHFFQLSAHDTTITAFGILALLIIIFSINKLIWLPLLDKSHRLLGE